VSSKVKNDTAEVGVGLQQAPVRERAKFQPDRANRLTTCPSTNF